MVIVIHSELERLLREFYQEMYALKETDGLEIYPIFEKCPDRKLYADYYEMIKKPVSLNTLKKRIPHYTEAQDFLNDVARIAWNAKTYNTKESDIHKYAKILDKYLMEDMFPRLQKAYPQVRYPYLGPLPDAEDEEEQAALRDKQNAEDVKNGIKPYDINQIALEKVKALKEEPSIASSRPVRSTRVMSERKIDSDDVEESRDDSHDDDDYAPAPRIALNMSRRPSANVPIVQTPQGTHTVGFSRTPSARSMVQIQSKSSSSKTNIRRGRPPIIDLPYIQRIKNVLKNLRKETNSRNRPLSAIFEHLPDEVFEGKLQGAIPNPLCMDDLRRKALFRNYKDFQDFQNDFELMIQNYKIIYSRDSESLDTISQFDRVFKILAKNELSRPDKYFLSDGIVRYPMDSVVVNNVTYNIGDWVLLKNTNDESKPVVGEIFKLWRTENGEQWLNACWYFRPEQTVHRVDRLFYKNEVVKTGQYRDHVIDDIQGKCYVIHFTRFQRGDPEFRVDGPLFVCEYRYNESDKIFNKIRTWKACLPEEIRDTDEPTIPINGRKFFKYPSPLRHLLPKDATVNSRIPQAVPGRADGPPLTGAVYLRPPIKRDDLGEYSTSLDCPKYIIRPGDPPEEGKMDFETGTILTNSITTTTYPRLGHVLPGQIGPSPVRSSTALHEPSRRPEMPTSYMRPPRAVVEKPLVSATKEAQTAQRMAQAQVQRYLVRKQMLQQRNDATPTDVTVPESDVSVRISGSALAPVAIDHPGSYILPMSITKNVSQLQRTDYDNYHRITADDDEPYFPRKRFKGEVIWFSGPSLDISERYLNLGDSFASKDLNHVFKDSSLEYVETNEISDKKNRILSRHQQASVIEKYNLEDRDSTTGDDSATADSSSAKGTGNHGFEDEIKVIPGTFVLGLRPTSKFIAHKLRAKEVV